MEAQLSQTTTFNPRLLAERVASELEADLRGMPGPYAVVPEEPSALSLGAPPRKARRRFGRALGWAAASGAALGLISAILLLQPWREPGRPVLASNGASAPAALAKPRTA